MHLRHIITPGVNSDMPCLSACDQITEDRCEQRLTDTSLNN